MKIINKSEFYALPIDTLYSDYDPCCFRDLKIKKETLYSHNIPIDFCYKSLIGNVNYNNTSEYIDLLEEAKNKKLSIKLDFECEERDGLYKKEQFFAVYEKEDVLLFIKELQGLIKN